MFSPKRGCVCAVSLAWPVLDLSPSSTLCLTSQNTSRSSQRRRWCSPTRTKPTSLFTLCLRALRMLNSSWGDPGYHANFYHAHSKCTQMTSKLTIAFPGGTLPLSSGHLQCATTRLPAQWRFWISPAGSKMLWARWWRIWRAFKMPWRSWAHVEDTRRLSCSHRSQADSIVNTTSPFWGSLCSTFVKKK